MSVRYRIGNELDIGPNEPFTYGDFKYPANWTALATPQDFARIGMESYEVADVETPTTTSYVPESITRRQCALQLLNEGMITVTEAKAMVKTGDMPTMVANLVSQLSTQDERDRAEIDFAADSYLRSNPLLVGLMTAAGATEADIDQFFVDAAVL